MAITSIAPVPSMTGSRGILRRILDAIMESRQLKANREVAEILARRDVLLPDFAPGEAVRRHYRFADQPRG